MSYSERLFRRVRVWLPAAVVSVFLLFHVEITGIISHIAQNDSVTTPEYRVTIPPHWIARYSGVKGDHFDIWAVEGYGLFRGWKYSAWRWWRAPYAEVEAHGHRGSPERYLEQRLRGAQVTSLSKKAIVRGEIECTEYVRPRRMPPIVLADRFVWADCIRQPDAMAPGLYVTFVGTPELLPEFYRFLRTRVEVFRP